MLDLKEIEKNNVINALETGRNLYNVLFYTKYDELDIMDIISQYVYELEENQNVKKARKNVISALKRDFIG